MSAVGRWRPKRVGIGRFDRLAEKETAAAHFLTSGSLRPVSTSVAGARILRDDRATMPAGGPMFPYRLFSHDGSGNFSLIQEFAAPDDEAAALFVGRWRVRPLELWQSTRKVKLWA